MLCIEIITNTMFKYNYIFYIMAIIYNNDYNEKNCVNNNHILSS